ncbi:MAG: ATP-binding cassette domain-containing protein [bacterium]|nr:ATP-binding cassette domain-containing protein [bacterium]
MSTSSSCMIRAEQLTKRFGQRTVVDSVSFTVEKGEVLGFLGPNAAGKTTTMKMLTCYFPPSEGNITVNGYNILENSLEVRRSIGFLPENVPLYTDMTVREYLEFAARAKGVGRSELKSKVERALERCNLGNVRNQLIATISRGYKQRVGIGQAIVNEPPVLIFDEPTVGLDPAQIKDIRELIKDLGKTSTVILSTHILPEVSLTCNRIIILNHGKVVATDTPDNLERKMQKGNHYRVVLLNPPGNAVKTLRSIAGVTAVTVLDDEQREGHIAYRIDTPSDVDASGLIASTVVENGWTLAGLQTEKMSLEDIFIDLVKSDDPVSDSGDGASGANADAAGEDK